MEVITIGTGAILTSSLSACVLVDQRILVDTPNGAMKTMRRQGLDPKAVDLLLLTHFHGDHTFDLPFLLLEQGLRSERETPLQVVGPSGTADRIEQLFNLAYPESWERVLSNVKLRVHGPDAVVKLGDLEARAIRVDHGGPEAYGFIVSDGADVVGITGDTVLSDGVHEILEASRLVVIDMSFEDTRSGHMGVGDVARLHEHYGETVTFVATHMSDEARAAAPAGIQIPSDGDRFVTGL